MSTLTPTTTLTTPTTITHAPTTTVTGTGHAATAMSTVSPTEVIEHQPIMEKEVIVEHPVEVRHEHHIQPVIHELEHQIQPIIRTEVTTERRVVETERDVMLPPVVEPVASAEPLPLRDERGIVTGTTTPTRHHATIGQKIRGTLKQVQGALTHNPSKKEEGRLLKQGIQPTKHSMA